MQTVEKQIKTAPDAQVSDKPLYVTLKDYVRSRVETGEWSVGQRVPSENELVELLGVSRMTANRALRELADEGFVVRVQGKGSFVANKKRTSQFQSVPNIADEIARNGGVHSANVTILRMESCDGELAEALSIEIGSPVSHSIMVHAEDAVPMQIEDRFVNHAIVPEYIDQDFSKTTPNGYLTSVAPIVRAEQHIEAVTAHPWECKLLAISKTEPCLLVRRRTWSQAGVISSVRLLYPGSRYRLYST
ncbi:histidine utilization repressor [Rhizobium skierniewicense]|uniref:histidine utilization repressor n=1 Tax=Rhizobium skierniewicense TaxID=984260 RepID=UPI00157245F3|nr:histidine utilization repressor [Rhizobium skierniewicense]NTF34831.1 histidine utilization repressor [Rhizobium skierniewicense]